MQTTTMQFEKHGIEILVDRVERTAFLMDYENVKFLGAFDASSGFLRWGGFDCLSNVPVEIVDTVRSMICHRGVKT